MMKLICVIIAVKPFVTVADDTYIKAGEKAKIVCDVTAFPPAEISWTHRSCYDEDFQNCSETQIVRISSSLLSNNLCNDNFLISL